MRPPNAQFAPVTRLALTVSLSLLALSSIGSCASNSGAAGAAKAATTKATVAPEAVDGHQRLATDVVPTAYALDLHLDPSLATFQGTVTIDIDVRRPTTSFRMHADGPTISQATVELDAGTPGAKAAAAKVVVGKNGGIAIVPAAPLTVGKARLTLKYTAPLPETPLGIYRVKSDDDWYAFTQFEPLEARRAFPCFDQPEFKTPFMTTLRVRKGQLALTNGPEVSRRTDGDHTVFSYATTKPLPTYLVAFAVGPFDVVEAPKQEGLPVIRTITTKGKGKLASWANMMTAKALVALQDYFGDPYPYAKLDQVAVPNFASGAMENVGLVTYRERLLLLGDGKDAPASSKMWATVVIAHELGHMWFGNKVTLAWWNDIWLNEAFATWISFKITHAIAPEFEAPLALSSQILRTMSWDAQAASRAIRQPIAHGGDVYNAFDPITYRKGAGVLNMLEAWLGEATFRKAIRAYIAAHAHGIATTPDLLKALDATTGKDVSGVVAKFLDQPGTPIVDVKLTCAPKSSPTLALSQTRYLPAGSTTAVGEAWRIPMCVRFGGPGIAKGGVRHCAELSAGTGAMTLPTKVCPAWIHPNDEERGYYRWSLEPKLLQALVGPYRNQLTIVEKASMANHLAALLEADKVDVATVVAALRALAKEKHQQVVRSLIAPLTSFARHTPEGPLRQRFASRIAAPILGPHVARLGFINAPAKTANSFADNRLRPVVSSAFYDLAGPGKAKQVVQKIVAKGLADFSSVPTPQFTAALPMAGRHGGPQLVEALAKALPKAPTPAHRVAMVRAMGSAVDAKTMLAGLNRLLDGTLRAQDLRELRRYASDGPEAAAAAWQWMKTHYVALLKLVGTKSARSLVWFGSDLCTEGQRKDFKAFFADPARDQVGVRRMAGVVEEIIARCVRTRATVQPALKTILGKGK